MRKRLIRSLSRIKAPKFLRDRGPFPIHLLHISKAAGTALSLAMLAANAQQNKYRFVPHAHKYRLEDVPEDEFCVFAVRDPLTRFYSGFYSRKRRGLPRRLNHWSPEEANAFAAFDHANELAEALSSQDATIRLRAMWAMASIFHVNSMQFDWIAKAWETGQSKVVAVLRQDNLLADLNDLMQTLGIEAPSLPDESQAANKGDYEGCPPLSNLARTNLKVWYHRDFAFLEIARTQWVEEARVRLRHLAARQRRGRGVGLAGTPWWARQGSNL